VHRSSDRTGSGVAGYNVYWGTSLTATTSATWTTSTAYDPPAVPSGVPHHLRAQTADNVDNWSEWTTLFSLQYDDQPSLISDTIPSGRLGDHRFLYIHRCHSCTIGCLTAPRAGMACPGEVNAK
jgi:hypothetical protein